MPEKKSSKPSYLQRCVADLVDQGKDLDAAFAICTSTMQKAGYLTKGPNMSQTKKGANRARHFSKMDDMDSKAAAYEKAVKAGRKSKTESVLSGLASALTSMIDGGLTEASIAKMNRKAKAGSKPTPSANQKPYNSLSAQEKKVVDKQVAADAKAFMDDYGRVRRDANGPMLWIIADPIPEYDYSSFEGFANGNFYLTLRPKLVGFNKVIYSHEGGDYTPSDEFDDSVEFETINIEAADALERGGLEELQRLIKDNIPSTREVSKALERYRERQRENEPRPYYGSSEPRTYHR